MLRHQLLATVLQFLGLARPVPPTTSHLPLIELDSDEGYPGEEIALFNERMAR